MAVVDKRVSENEFVWVDCVLVRKIDPTRFKLSIWKHTVYFHFNDFVTPERHLVADCISVFFFRNMLSLLDIKRNTYFNFQWFFFLISLSQLRISAYSLTRSKCVWIVLGWRNNLSRFIFIMRPVNPEAHESELYKKISFMIHLK